MFVDFAEDSTADCVSAIAHSAVITRAVLAPEHTSITGLRTHLHDGGSLAVVLPAAAPIRLGRCIRLKVPGHSPDTVAVPLQVAPLSQYCRTGDN